MEVKISVIIPVYNVERYLTQCVNSVTLQSYKNLEIILVNDGSPDNSPHICDDFAKRDSRIRVVHKTNGGLSSARNAGIKIATGDYILFLDSDDYWDSTDAMKECAEVCMKYHPDVVMFGYKKYYQRDSRTDVRGISVSNFDTVYTIDDLLHADVFTTSACNKCVSRRLFNEHHLDFVENQLSEDIEYCIKIIKYADRFMVIDNPFYIYRQQNAVSISSNIGVKNLRDIAEVLIKYTNECKEEGIKKRLPLLNYLALQYVLWMTNSAKVRRDGQLELISEMKTLWWLTMYDWCSYVKKVKLVRWFGFDIIRILLKIYKRLR